MSKKKKKKNEEPKVHGDLKGFKMEIDSFGEISSTFSIDKINEFLNKNVEDKKLKDRDDLDEIQNGSDEEK
ncbi:hypothetical protein E4S40_15110 [Algoriphagus kandeliae]|uniref:Uncharacterized protein n=1 Tax=Algoriphagus kandeliae TaxID=2562278 RepID=A0A4Y9QRD7_9BACT|nr:hypothetical protein [Algoriphagus kandeliae]TFV93573.1 hypothetical protein E4S40_15110 [Algoriphagus kandeliae]